jgi:type I restriction enzyme, S subunit
MSGQKVPKGYKQTEVGVIPEDWGIATAAEICDLVVDCKNRTPPIVEGGEFAVVRTPNVRNGRFVLEELRFTDASSFREWTARAVPQVGDILITREAPLGEVCLVPSDYKVCLGQRMMLYRPDQNKTDSAFFLYSLMAPAVQSCLMKKIGGSTVGHAKVDDIRNLEIPIPPTIDEQKLIARALSDIDALIEGLEGTIGKKRHIKQGAMQELLTGERRLGGFSGEWIKTTLGKVCSHIIDGTHYTPKYVESGIPFYSVETITDDNFSDTKFISHEEHQNLIKRCKPERGDILMTRIGSLGKTKLIDWDVNASIYVSLALLKLNDQISAEYIYRYTQSEKFIKDLEQRSLIHAAPKKINLDQMSGIPIYVPIDALEQTAIATILSDMDTEIATLEAKLTKTRQLKQGMMHELLTGRIRLVEEAQS